jgi:glycine cleavage system regulatory protein
MTSLVVTLIGPDRPGMVSAVSQAATAHDANWTDSLMANFAGQFAGIVQLDVPPDRCEALLTALRLLESPDMHVAVARASAATTPPPSRRLTLDLLGHDRPGIIHTISSQLASHGVSIDKLQTHIASGAMSGEQMFHMHAQLTVPRQLATDALRAGLEGLANELMVDISFEAGASD